MNMTIGVLVDVVKSASVTERETIQGKFMRDGLMKILFQEGMASEDTDFAHFELTQQDLMAVLETHEALSLLHQTDVDTVALVDLTEIMFVDGPLPFSEVVQAMLQLRRVNVATVKDIMDMRRLLLQELKPLDEEVFAKNMETFFRGAGMEPTARIGIEEIAKMLS